MSSNQKKMGYLGEDLSDYVLNTISTGVLVIDRNYEVKFANKHVKSKLYLDSNDPIGQNLFEFEGLKNRLDLKEALAEVAKHNKSARLTNISPIVHGNSDGYMIDLLIHPQNDLSGKVVGWILICEEANLNRGFFNDALRVNIFVRYVVNLMSEGATVLNREGKLEYANKRFYEMLGYQPNDIVDKDWTTWCYEGDLKFEGGRKKIKNEMIESGVSVFRLRLKRKDGSLLPVTMSVLKNVEEKLDIGSIGVIVDETEKLKLETEFMAVSNLNKKILETISTYIVTLDVDLNIKFINKRVEEEFGVDSKEAVGKKISEILPALRVIEDWSSWVLRSLRPYKVDRYKLNTRNENVVFINVDIQPLYLANRLNGVVCSFDDVTLSAKLEEQIEISYRELEITHGKLANFLKRQSDFLADVSHELRTPLTIIKGNIEVVLQDKQVPNEELTEVLALVENEVSRMSVMVVDLLMLTKMDQGESALRTEIYSTTQLINDLLSKIELYGEYENRIQIDSVENISIKADRDKMLTLVWNLLENALKYSAKEEEVRLKIRRSDVPNELLIEVIDRGIGMAEKDLKNIFDRFFRVDKARSRDKGGSGLGLAICKRIAEAHLGRIEAKSVINAGTRFMVYLPIIVNEN